MRAIGLLAVPAVVLAVAAGACGGGEAGPPATAEPPSGEATAQATDEAVSPPPETDRGTGTETEAASGYGEAAEEEPTTTGEETSDGLTAEESQWLEESLVLDSLFQVERAYEEFADAFAAGEFELELPLESLFGQGECEQALEAAGPAPSERLERIARLTRRACRHRERADQEILFYETFDEKTGERTVHEPDFDAALAEYERANDLAARAFEALDAIGA